MPETRYDVVIVGAGNAALCAALSALETGASVAVLECAPEDESGGNSRFTAGAIRFAYAGLDDLRRVVTDLSEKEIETTDFGTYSEDQFFDDMFHVTQYRCDPDMVETLVRQSLPTIVWMREKGVRFVPIYGRQAYKIDGRFKFWGGLTVEARGGGPGLVDSLTDVARKAGAEVMFSTRALSLIFDGTRVSGVCVRRAGQVTDIRADSVVLAAGGFESNAEWRTRYLGPGWELAKVRGSRFNNGDGIRMALEIGALPAGNWSGCHAVGWDLNAPPYGDLAVGDQFQKHSYPLGIVVNAKGERFVDEGADFRNYTYAKYGREILNQPAQFAWQVFDKKVLHLLRDEYRIKRVTKVSADTIEDLAAKMEGVDGRAFVETVERFNASVMADVPFNPNVKDGRGTRGIAPAKTNWANPLTEPPFEAYGVTCGITFTFGGVGVDGNARVLDLDRQPIPGLYAAGEMVGGLFYFNYPGGTGLMAGAVWGRTAGRAAGEKT